MEPQLSASYSEYLAEYLRSGFSVRTENDGKTWSVPYFFVGQLRINFLEQLLEMHHITVSKITQVLG